MSQLAAIVEGGGRYRWQCVRLRAPVIICSPVDADQGGRDVPEESMRD
jgi:hypothetical protein